MFKGKNEQFCGTLLATSFNGSAVIMAESKFLKRFRLCPTVTCDANGILTSFGLEIFGILTFFFFSFFERDKGTRCLHLYVRRIDSRLCRSEERYVAKMIDVYCIYRISFVMYV